MSSALDAASTSSLEPGVEPIVPAASAGIYHGAYMREIRLLHEKSGGKAVDAVRAGLEELSKRELLTADEVHDLARLCGRAFEATHNGDKVNEVAEDVRSSFHRLLAGQSSPTALAIASVITDVTSEAACTGHSSQPTTMARASSSNTVDAADVGGTVAGAAVGGILGGVAGAIAGAVLGGIGASGAALFTGDGETK